MKTTIVNLILLLGINAVGLSQELTQTIRGQIKDECIEAPLIGAHVIIKDSDPFIGAVTDLNGFYRLENVPVGRQTLAVSYLGYEARVLPNILLTTGKEMVLNVDLRESLNTLNEVVIDGGVKKGENLNKMAAISARTFTVEETKRYAGAIDDPSRMASNYAGVGAVDGDNDLIIRGNSPRGMFWRLEGIEIPNPNHFSSQGASGGPISMLNSNMMKTSEFYTGAFPAEYGNGFSGVFDINLRLGNNEQREYAFQLGLLGTDLSVEGPFSKNYNGSYLVNYRYSTLSLFNAVGIDVAGNVVPQFQDLSFNVSLPTKKLGNFGVFGLGGSGIVFEEFQDLRYDYVDKFQTDMGVSGIRHSYILGEKTYLKTVLAVMGENRQFYRDQLDTLSGEKLRDSYDGQNRDIAFRATTSLNHKFSKRSTIKVGVIYNQLQFNYAEEYDFNDEQGRTELIDAKGSAFRYQAFSQWQYRINSRFTLNPGIHLTYFTLTDEFRAEPRVGANFQLDEKSSINAGLGMHSKTWDLALYHSTGIDENGNEYQPNLNLEMLRSYHFVLGYERMITDNVKFNIEAYYQRLTNVPIVNSDTSFKSLLNNTRGYSTNELVNEGTGENYGVELTVEKYFTKQFFFMLTSSLFNSTYVAGDGIERKTAFNGHYINNLLFGKEWNLGSPKKVFGIGSKAVLAGGRRVTPILLEESIRKEETVYDESNGLSRQLDDYLRLDIQLTYRINAGKATHLFKLDVQNATNRQNPWGERYNVKTQKIEVDKQAGLLPVLSYKVTF